VAHEDKIIEHLSREIATHAGYLMTFRARVAFTILIGPFVLLGSFLIATDGKIPANRLGSDSIVAIVVACACYLALGVYGAMLDKHVTSQCNTWRQQINSIRMGSEDALDTLPFDHNPIKAYAVGVGLVLIAFLSMVYLLTTL